MFVYRPYVFISRKKSLKSSRVQLVKPKSLRDVYTSFVQTGEVPSVRNGGFDTSLDVPVCSFGDVEDAVALVSSISSRLSEIKKEREEIDAKLKEQQKAEFERLYHQIHSDTSSSVSPETSSEVVS